MASWLVCRVLPGALHLRLLVLADGYVSLLCAETGDVRVRLPLASVARMHVDRRSAKLLRLTMRMTGSQTALVLRAFDNEVAAILRAFLSHPQCSELRAAGSGAPAQDPLGDACVFRVMEAGGPSSLVLSHEHLSTPQARWGYERITRVHTGGGGPSGSPARMRLTLADEGRGDADTAREREATSSVNLTFLETPAHALALIVARAAYSRQRHALMLGGAEVMLGDLDGPQTSSDGAAPSPAPSLLPCFAPLSLQRSPPQLRQLAAASAAASVTAAAAAAAAAAAVAAATAASALPPPPAPSPPLG
jgi:hypothetical protein